LIDVTIRRQSIALPHPGIAVSKLLNKSQSSFVKRASGLRADEGEMGSEATSECSGELKVIGESTFTWSTEKGKAGLAQGSWSSGMTTNTGGIIVVMTSPLVVEETEESADKMSPTRGGK
jgi:hypothetical protein